MLKVRKNISVWRTGNKIVRCFGCGMKMTIGEFLWICI